MPYIPFPPNFPVYIPKDKLKSWFKSYVETLELNVWVSTSLIGGNYDAEQKRWDVKVQNTEGTVKELHPRHLIFATGVSGIPSYPTIPGLEQFAGTFVHSHSYTASAEWTGRKTVVIGSGNSGHDIAQDLHAHGADVTIVQRSPTTVQTLEQANKYFQMYSEGASTNDCDLQTLATPYPELIKSLQTLTVELEKADLPLLQSLEKRGFCIDTNHDTGYLTKYLNGRAGGYYLDVGCSELIAKDDIHVLQFKDVARVVPEGLQLKNGSTIPAELIVAATGYKGLQTVVRNILGDKIANRVGEVWGFDLKGEQRNMWQKTAQTGLWFTAGGFYHSRIYSKYLALQIKAMELGILV